MKFYDIEAKAEPNTKFKIIDNIGRTYEHIAGRVLSSPLADIFPLAEVMQITVLNNEIVVEVDVLN